jgi:tetratricopeptide (TPR) repeat protein
MVATCVPRVVGLLHEANERLEEAAAAYARAITLCRSSRIPVEEGRTGLQLALLERKRGNIPQALDAVVRAIPLLERSEAPFYLDQAVALRMELQGLADTDPTTSIDAVAASIDTEYTDLSPQAAPDGTVTLLFSDILHTGEAIKEADDFNSAD